MLTALSISGVAIYYSVAGLVAIFAGAAIPIIIMGGILETAKLVTAVWLHRFWDEAPRWLRYYLLSAVAVLMLITSMGIFGFLSKAHIEQTGVGNENVAQLQVVNNEIARSTDKISAAEANINRLKTQGTSGQASLQAQIDKEQDRIDAAYARIQPLVDEQQEIINNFIAIYQKEIDKLDSSLEQLQQYINNGEIAKAQSFIGVKADGKYGPVTAEAFRQFQDKKTIERNDWVAKIENANSKPEVAQARETINNIRKNADIQIQQSQNLITEYSKNLRTAAESKDVTQLIAQEQTTIEELQLNMSSLITQKYDLESQARKLEIEVGPVKYIAELIYGSDTTFDLLEQSVRWVIIILIFVFDPLAVLLLIASQYSLQLVNPSYKSIFDIGRGKQPTEEYVDLKPIEKTKVRTKPTAEKKDNPPKPEISKAVVVEVPKLEEPKPEVKPFVQNKPSGTKAKVEEQPQKIKSDLDIDIESAREWVNVNIQRNRYKTML